MIVKLLRKPRKGYQTFKEVVEICFCPGWFNLIFKSGEHKECDDNEWGLVNISLKEGEKA